MDFLLDYIGKKMGELDYPEFEIGQQLIEVDPGSIIELQAKNDVFFFANAFTGGSTGIDGKITGENDGMRLKPYIVQTSYFKHKFYFTGQIRITNNSPSDTLYVELLIATPRQWKKM